MSKFSATITNRHGEIEEHEIAIPEKMLAMLVGNITDWRLIHNIKAWWDNPRDPRGLIKNMDGPPPPRPKFLDDPKWDEWSKANSSSEPR